MNDREYLLMRQMEDSHWWYSALHDSVAAELKAHLSERTQAHILDAGCGTGGMLEVLRASNREWQLTGLDISSTALAFTEKRGFARLAQGSVDDLPFPTSSFDAVISLDVLYFSGVDDARALVEFRRVLKPGGVLVLNLPAFEALRGSHDRAVNGVRRYRPGQLRRMLAASGFKNLRSHCWNLWLCPAIFIWRQFSRLWERPDSEAPPSDLFSVPRPLNSLLTAFTRLDMAFCRTLHAGLGTSVMTVARKQMAHFTLQP